MSVDSRRYDTPRACSETRLRAQARPQGFLGKSPGCCTGIQPGRCRRREPCGEERKNPRKTSRARGARGEARRDENGLEVQPGAPPRLAPAARPLRAPSWPGPARPGPPHGGSRRQLAGPAPAVFPNVQLAAAGARCPVVPGHQPRSIPRRPARRHATPRPARAGGGRAGSRRLLTALRSPQQPHAPPHPAPRPVLPALAPPPQPAPRFVLPALARPSPGCARNPAVGPRPRQPLAAREAGHVLSPPALPRARGARCGRLETNRHDFLRPLFRKRGSLHEIVGRPRGIRDRRCPGVLQNLMFIFWDRPAH